MARASIGAVAGWSEERVADLLARRRRPGWPDQSHRIAEAERAGVRERAVHAVVDIQRIVALVLHLHDHRCAAGYQRAPPAARSTAGSPECSPTQAPHCRCRRHSASPFDPENPGCSPSVSMRLARRMACDPVAAAARLVVPMSSGTPATTTSAPGSLRVMPGNPEVVANVGVSDMVSGCRRIRRWRAPITSSSRAQPAPISWALTHSPCTSAPPAHAWRTSICRAPSCA